MSVEIPAELIDYVAARDRQRWQQADKAWTALTPREQRLVHDAAVMGYVQGVMAAGCLHRTKVPPDVAVIRLVIAACQSMADLYPTLAGGGS